MLVEVTPERCAQIFPSGLDNLMSIAEGFQPENGSCSTRGLHWEAGIMLQEGADLSEGVATVAPSLVVLVAKSSEDVVLPTIAGAAPLADFAEVAAGILFPADLAGSVTSAVADSAVAGILFPADPAGILFPADPTGILFPADTAGILFPADTVRTDTADVVFLADAEEVTVGLADLADAGIRFPADPAGILFAAHPAGILFTADPAGILFTADPAGILLSADPAGILFPADPSGILFAADPAGILFPADPAGILFAADPSGTAAADVAFLANADPVTMGVTDLADAGAVPLAAPDMTFPEIEVVTVVSSQNVCPAMMVGLMQNDLLNGNSEDPREVVGDRLSAPMCPVIPERHGERECDDFGDDGYGYYEKKIDSLSGSSEYDDPRDIREWDDWSDNESAEQYWAPFPAEVGGDSVLTCCVSVLAVDEAVIITDSCSGDPRARRALNSPEFRCDPDSDRMLCRQWIPSALDTSVRETGVTVCWIFGRTLIPVHT